MRYVVFKMHVFGETFCLYFTSSWQRLYISSPPARQILPPALMALTALTALGSRGPNVHPEAPGSNGSILLSTINTSNVCNLGGATQLCQGIPNLMLNRQSHRSQAGPGGQMRYTTAVRNYMGFQNGNRFQNALCLHMFQVSRGTGHGLDIMLFLKASYSSANK